MRALGVNVKRIRVKRVSVVNSQHSDATSLKEHIVAVSICDRRVERMPSSRHRRSKDEDSVAITCAYRLRTVLKQMFKVDMVKRIIRGRIFQTR